MWTKTRGEAGSRSQTSGTENRKPFLALLVTMQCCNRTLSIWVAALFLWLPPFSLPVQVPLVGIMLWITATVIKGSFVKRRVYHSGTDVFEAPEAMEEKTPVSDDG